MFAALARAPRHRAGALSLRFVDPAMRGPARVSYAVGRALGGAVERNRVRRRLRAAVSEHASELVPGRAYLFGASREALTMPFAELSACVARLLALGRVREAP